MIKKKPTDFLVVNTYHTLVQATQTACHTYCMFDTVLTDSYSVIIKELLLA